MFAIHDSDLLSEGIITYGKWIMDNEPCSIVPPIETQWQGRFVLYEYQATALIPLIDYLS
jgi:hypothetical protein